MMGDATTGALRGIRVLDLADAIGLYCTKMLAGLGADVIKIVPPGGDRVRNIGPFYKDEPHREKSLFWFHFNANKRSITLNLQTKDGRKLFKKLSSTADIVVETSSPGAMEEWGIGWSTLSSLNPRLIFASITPFGQEGPWKNYKASDLVGNAVDGLLNNCGWPRRGIGMQRRRTVAFPAKMATSTFVSGCSDGMTLSDGWTGMASAVELNGEQWKEIGGDTGILRPPVSGFPRTVESNQTSSLNRRAQWVHL